MRMDMTTGEWHRLIAPVLPHASTDKDLQNLNVVRIEAAMHHTVYAIARDPYTIAAERHDLSDDLWSAPAPIHIRRQDAAASLKLFTHTKDDDPGLRITIDTVSIPIAVAGQAADVPQLALTLEAEDGTRLVLHDHRDPSADPLAGWRRILGKALHRPLTETTPGALSLGANHLAKWGKAVRAGERLVLLGGADGPLLVLVEDHFAGVWAQTEQLTDPGKVLEASPFADELPAPAAGEDGDTVPDLRTTSGVFTGRVDPEDGTGE